MKKQIVLLGSLALFGAGCAIPGATFVATPSTAGTPVKNEIAQCAQTPQVYYFNKLGFGAREIAEIQTNVVAPLVEYYRTLGDGGFQIVSIAIKRTATGITVETIVDQSGSDEPVYHGFVHARGSSGAYPVWVPEVVPPGYSG